jgi:hypothetical protein
MGDALIAECEYEQVSVVFIAPNPPLKEETYAKATEAWVDTSSG